MRSIRIIFLIALFIGLLATFPVTTEAQFEQIWGGTDGKTCLVDPNTLCDESNYVGFVHSGGTGFLIGPDIVMTADHVSEPDNAFAIHLLYNTSKNLWGSEESKNWHWTAEKISLPTTNSEDIAILRLQDPIGLKYGYFTISSDIPEVGDKVYHIGHPGLGTKKLSRHFPDTKDNESNVTYSSGVVIKYNAPVAHGNSGSPIIKDGKVVGVAYQKVGGAHVIGNTFRNQALFNRIKEEVEKSITRTKSFDITNKESVTIKEYQLPIELRATSQKGTSLRLKDPNGKFELGSKSGGWWIRGLYAGFNPVYELRLKAGETLTKAQHTVTVIHSPGFYGKGGTEKTVYINTESTSTATAPSPFAMHQLQERKVTKQRNSLTTTWGAIKIQ